MDIWDRSIVGWSLHDVESGKYAADLLRKSCLANLVKPHSLVSHQDNGSPMISCEFRQELSHWGISSYSRPGVSDDNPFSESLFKTLKYRPTYPFKFRDITQANEWMESFVNWYNNEHYHSGIGYVTPNDRRTGEDKIKIQKRRETYTKAKLKNPSRWSKDIRKWESTNTITLNPNYKNKKKEKIVAKSKVAI